MTVLKWAIGLILTALIAVGAVVVWAFVAAAAQILAAVVAIFGITFLVLRLLLFQGPPK